VVRELLLQEARRLGVVGTPESDGDHCETEDEATIRALVAREVTTPRPDEVACRRYYANNPARFRSADRYAVSHILVAADTRDPDGYARARETATILCRALQADPEAFAALARSHSDCPSAAQDGCLGQVTEDEVTPEFAAALRRLTPGTMTEEPVATRYGFHVIHLKRRFAGTALPYEAVADRIADYLAARVERLALAQYVARLVRRATIEGVVLPEADAMRVN
jgi:peptidyl-prolyl cis-trans isomerase C